MGIIVLYFNVFSVLFVDIKKQIIFFYCVNSCIVF